MFIPPVELLVEGLVVAINVQCLETTEDDEVKVIEEVVEVVDAIVEPVNLIDQLVHLLIHGASSYHHRSQNLK